MHTRERVLIEVPWIYLFTRTAPLDVSGITLTLLQVELQCVDTFNNNAIKLWGHIRPIVKMSTNISFVNEH